ncbi:MAG: tyrosine-protein phosphatase [Treponema sp.]|jgi:protein-tyrosine phosphatase|nr:tyrosine-protein phosphatase [Treponema sp.]
MNHNATEPGRLLALEGVYNLRDLGGYPTGDGRRIRLGTLYRAGDLHGLTEGDRVFLETRSIRTIVDFRGLKEQERAPDRDLATRVETFALPIEAGNIMDLSSGETGLAGAALMEALYTQMVESARPQYRRFFSILSCFEHTPLLFHCSAGKDRTGLAAAFILSALGVDRKLIYRDYLRSAEYLQEHIQQWLIGAPHLEPLFSVRRSYLEAAFAHIDRAFGGIDRYLREELGADIPALREQYTVAVDPG